MDDIWITPSTTVSTSTRPVIWLPDVNSALLAIRGNTARLRDGRYDPQVSRQVLLDYLAVCAHIAIAASSSKLVEACSVLTYHSLCLPVGSSFGDDYAWQARVRTALLSLGVDPEYDLGLEVCNFGHRHAPDHLWYICLVGDNYYALDYYSRTSLRLVPLGLRGAVSLEYSRCECGVWSRTVSVF